MRFPSGFLVLGLMAILACGCSDAKKFPIAKVRGKVTFNGQPVPDAVVTFSPQAAGAAGESKEVGKGAAGTTDQEGVYVLSTYGQGDGAQVGKHNVTVGASDANKPLAGKSPPNLVLEVKPGNNDLPIELVK